METYNDILAEAEYSEARMHYNNDRLGRPENRLDVPALRFCHCGQPLNAGECECENCAAEWQEFITDSDRYALAHPGALM